MNLKFTFICVYGLLLAFGLGGLARGEDASEEDLRKHLGQLQAEVTRLRAEGVTAEKMAELERRIDLLAAEIERSRTGGATETGPTQGVPGFGPAASKVYRTQKGVSIGGYGEALYENFASLDQAREASGPTDRLDFLRAVVYVGYKFSDRILFNSEIEFEHASTGEGDEERGEVSVEQGYLDIKPWKTVGIRAGMVVLPLGFVNELHEPPIFHGARRTEVESSILPTTWHENGLGLFGETGHFQWRAYVVAGLSSAGFSAEGIEEGRQQGSQSLARDLALTGRLDFAGTPGLLLGGSFFTGNSGQGADVDGLLVGGRVTIFDIHAQYQRRGLHLRALGVQTRIGEAALINAQNGLNADESVGSRQYGFYVEAAHEILAPASANRWSVVPFLRYERLDTQERVPAGFERNPENDRTAWTAGLTVKPLSNVALKADYQWLHNRARTGANQLNLAIGYLF